MYTHYKVVYYEDVDKHFCARKEAVWFMDSNFKTL